MMKVRLSPLVDERFVHLAAVSPISRRYFAENANGAQKSMPKINQATLARLPIPLPPVDEQRRIVAKVDELMTLCDRLEISIAAGDDQCSRLLDALVAEALAPAELQSA